MSNDLPDNKSPLPGSILEHITNAVVHADKTAAIRRWNRTSTVIPVSRLHLPLLSLLAPT
jgi:hypothetical protein